MNEAYIGLGGNTGNTEELFKIALELLAAIPGIEIDTVSSIYRTEPLGFKEQPFFTNQVARLVCHSKISPEFLLETMLRIETELGRTRGQGHRNGPRPIDLDLLVFGNETRSSDFLNLPHPRMLERAFVLVPMSEITEELPLVTGTSFKDALSGINYHHSGIEILQD